MDTDLIISIVTYILRAIVIIVSIAFLCAYWAPHYRDLADCFKRRNDEEMGQRENEDIRNRGDLWKKALVTVYLIGAEYAWINPSRSISLIFGIIFWNFFKVTHIIFSTVWLYWIISTWAPYFRCLVARFKQRIISFKQRVSGFMQRINGNLPTAQTDVKMADEEERGDLGGNLWCLVFSTILWLLWQYLFWVNPGWLLL